MKNIIIEIKTDNEDLYKSFIPYFQTFNKGLNSIGIIPTVSIINDIETTKGSIKELTAQRDTFIKLMNVYRDLSKGRKDTKTVIDYINELETKLNEYEKAGGVLDEGEAWYHLAQKYEQTLDEIEIYSNTILKDYLKYSQGCINITKKIKDIISKAKEDNNE